MRADRLLQIVLRLQHVPRVSARRLAQELDVSPRTIHRDMEALSIAGIPVYAERGREGGYALLDTFRAQLAYLNRYEIQALFVSNAGVLDDLGLNGAAASGAHKLGQALPQTLAEDAARVRRLILVDGASWRQTAADHPHLATVHDALWQTRQLVMDYTRADGSSRQRTVHPWGLVAKGRLWYLVAGVEVAPSDDAGPALSAPLLHAGAYFEPRTYRVSRMAQVSISPDPATVPPDFDLAAFWDDSSTRFLENLPRYPVTVWVSPAAQRRLPSAGWYLQIEEHGPTRADGWQQMQLAFHTEETAIACLTGLGDQIEVIDPPAVAAGILATARSILAQRAR